MYDVVVHFKIKDLFIVVDFVHFKKCHANALHALNLNNNDYHVIYRKLVTTYQWLFFCVLARYLTLVTCYTSTKKFLLIKTQVINEKYLYFLILIRFSKRKDIRETEYLKMFGQKITGTIFPGF